MFLICGKKEKLELERIQMNKFKDFSTFLPTFFFLHSWAHKLVSQVLIIGICHSATHLVVHVTDCSPDKINQGTVAQLAQGPGVFCNKIRV